MLFVWIVFVLFPIATLFHELGHYYTARSFGIGTVRTILGIGPTLFRFSNRYIAMEVHAFYFIGGYTIGVESSQLRGYERSLISLNGPLVNAVVSCFAWIYIESGPIGLTHYLLLFAMINFWIAIGNLFPVKIGRKKSDGYIVFEVMLQHMKKRFGKVARSRHF